MAKPGEQKGQGAKSGTTAKPSAGNGNGERLLDMFPPNLVSWLIVILGATFAAILLGLALGWLKEGISGSLTERDGDLAAAAGILLGVGVFAYGYRRMKASHVSRTPSNRGNTIWITVTITFVLLAVLFAYAGIQFAFLDASDLALVLKTGLLLELVAVAFLFMIGPTSTELYEEDVDERLRQSGDANAPKADYERTREMAWTTRLRTLLTVSLTLVLLVIVLSWTLEPDSLLVESTQTTGGGLVGNNTTATSTNKTMALNPFVKTFMDVYLWVAAFFFASVATENSLKTLVQPRKPGQAGGGGEVVPEEPAAPAAGAGTEVMPPKGSPPAPKTGGDKG